MSKFSKEENNEIESLLREGYTVSDVVEIISAKSEQPVDTIRSRVYTVRATLPEDIRKQSDMRKQYQAALKEKLKAEPKVKPEVKPDIKAVIASKIEIVGVKLKKTELIFPMVARHLANRHIVLFTSLHRGVVLHAGNSALFAGHVSDSLIACTDTTVWEILDEVTLTFKS